MTEIISRLDHSSFISDMRIYCIHPNYIKNKLRNNLQRLAIYGSLFLTLITVCS